MHNKTFELDVIISLAHHTCILDVTEEDKRDLVEHVVGRAIEDHELGEESVRAAAYLLDKYPRIAQAAKLTSYVLPDQGRYNKLIDLCKKNHEIEPMETKAVEKKEVEELTQA